MRALRRPTALGTATSLLSLGVWAGLGIGANFGLHPIAASLGLLWLVTLGLPTSLGVVSAATMWGRFEPLTGIPRFLALAAALGGLFQVAAFRWIGRRRAAARAQGRPIRWRVFRGAGGVAVGVGLGALWLTDRPGPPLPVVVDAHAHLFGDAGWPPVHNRTCGLSAAQKANPSYGMLLRLLRLDPTGDLNELYIAELVRQAREAQAVLGAFRVVLLAQDGRYTDAGEPDWVHTTVYVPNEHLFAVTRRYPDLFLPCPSINPQRKDWAAELAYCRAQGARVLKIHPPTQAVNPDHPRFRDFYRQCAALGLCIMVHTGTEHAAPVASATLGDPRLLRLALDEGCTVIAAHAGMKAFFDPPAEDHFPDLVRMMADYPRLHADTAVLGSQFRWRCIPGIVRSPGAAPRMLHASDWPFPANAFSHWHRLHPFTMVRLMAEKNLFLRDLRLKQALGMTPESFRRSGRLLGIDSSLPPDPASDSRAP